MSAPLAFLYRSHAWNSGLAAFCAVVMRCVVSPRCLFRTRTAIRSEGLKLSLMYSDAVAEAQAGFSDSFIGIPRASDRLRRIRIRRRRGHNNGSRVPRKQSVCQGGG